MATEMLYASVPPLALQPRHWKVLIENREATGRHRLALLPGASALYGSFVSRLVIILALSSSDFVSIVVTLKHLAKFSCGFKSLSKEFLRRFIALVVLGGTFKDLNFSFF